MKLWITFSDSADEEWENVDFWSADSQKDAERLFYDSVGHQGISLIREATIDDVIKYGCGKDAWLETGSFKVENDV